MQIDPLWFIVATVFSAAMAGGLVYFVMQSRTEVRLARQREKLAVAQAVAGVREEVIGESLKNVEESTRRQALDEFIADIRVEERHYVRTQKALFMNRKSVVRQERIFFRNLPLSNWVEHEMPFEEGADVEQLAQAMAIFTPDGLLDSTPVKPRRLTSGGG